jgi:hypothetical protein
MEPLSKGMQRFIQVAPVLLFLSIWPLWAALTLNNCDPGCVSDSLLIGIRLSGAVIGLALVGAGGFAIAAQGTRQRRRARLSLALAVVGLIGLACWWIPWFFTWLGISSET